MSYKNSYATPSSLTIALIKALGCHNKTICLAYDKKKTKWNTTVPLWLKVQSLVLTWMAFCSSGRAAATVIQNPWLCIC